MSYRPHGALASGKRRFCRAIFDGGLRRPPPGAITAYMASGICEQLNGWDRTRAERGGAHVFADDRVELATDFECGNGAHPRSEGGGYAIDLEPEPGEHRFGGKAYYFCVGVRNLTGRDLRLRLRLYGRYGGGFATGTRSVVLRAGGQWSHLPAGNIRPVGRADAVDLLLDPPAGGEPLWASNFHFQPWTETAGWCEGLRSHPLARVSVYGRSAGSRPLYRVEIGREDADAPALVFARTPQPSEGAGTMACRAIGEYLLTDDPPAVACRRNHRVVILPETNPDGVVTGLGLSHPGGAFPYFQGHLAAEGDPAALPEMRAAWGLLRDVRPWWFVEWHGNNWARRPGHMLLRFRPELLEDRRRRELWKRIDEDLLALPDTHHGNWTGREEGLYQVTLPYAAVTRLGAIAHMIKYHEARTPEAIRRHAIDCLLAGLDRHRQMR
jgi:hypothetical protein